MLNKRLEAIAAYLKQVGKDLARGDSTEHTHRPALQQLVQQLHKGIVCVNEPKGSTAAGHPDMKVLLGETPLGFIVARAAGDVREHRGAGLVRRLLYRPFDLRWTWYSGVTRGFIGTPSLPRMFHLLTGSNVALITTRQTQDQWDAFVANGLCGHTACAAYDINCTLPLYVYPEVSRPGEQQRLEDTEGSHWPAGKDGRRPNLSPKFVEEMEQKLGLKFVPEQPEAVSRKPSAVSAFGPEDVFNYIYAVFHSPIYRKRHAEFLKIDFPRVPLTSDKKLFWKLVALGRELVALHLLESPTVNDYATKYPKKGSDTVEQVRYVEPDSEAVSRKPSAVGGRVFINDDQYFEGVKPEWFEFHIGGYQVLQKWLKDRKGRKLSNDDITHYQRVVVAIKETIRLRSEIDKAITKWPMT